MAESNDEAGKGVKDIETWTRFIKEAGVVAAQDLMKTQLHGWKNVRVKIGVTGNAGVGKSTFVNIIRGIQYEDEIGAAKTDVVEATFEPASFTYPDNPNIELWDLPGIGTPKFPDLDTYCKKVNLATYDTFLILTSERFTEHELELAKKIKAEGKSFFLIRTKIDEAYRSEKRKRNHNKDAMLKRIQAYCHESVKDLGIREDEIFLISNVYGEESDWPDFNRLVNAILDTLPARQKEALTLSLKILSKDIVKGKVQLFINRLWMVTFLCFVKIPFRAFSTESPYVISKSNIEQNAKFYRSELGLPEEDSDEFKALKPEFQEKMKIFYPKDNNDFWEKYFVPSQLMSRSSFGELLSLTSDTQGSLRNILRDMEKLSLAMLDEASQGQ